MSLRVVSQQHNEHVRVALTETKNAYEQMPDRIEDLHKLQPDVLEEIRSANVAHNIDLIAEASERYDCAIICLGELFSLPYFALSRDSIWRTMAEPIDPSLEAARTVREICAAAKRYSIVVVAPMYELDSASGKRYDTAVVISEEGAVLGKYRKVHIPQGSNELGAFNERFYYGPSDQAAFPVFETRSAGKIGINICYDRHFEGVVRELARRGAEIIFSPAVTFGEKSRRMWDMEFRVDAGRHNVFVGGSNRRGAEPPWSQNFFGQSYFAGPDGEVLSNESLNKHLVVCDLDLLRLRQADGSGWNLLDDARLIGPIVSVSDGRERNDVLSADTNTVEITPADGCALVFVYGTLRSGRPNESHMQRLAAAGLAERVPYFPRPGRLFNVNPPGNSRGIGDGEPGSNWLLTGDHKLVVFGPWRTPWLLHADDCDALQYGGDVTNNNHTMAQQNARNRSKRIVGELWSVECQRGLKYLDIFENVPAAYERRSIVVWGRGLDSFPTGTFAHASCYFKSTHTVSMEHVDLAASLDYEVDPTYIRPEDRPTEFRLHLEQLRRCLDHANDANGSNQ